MWAKFWALIEAIRALFYLIKEIQRYLEARKKAEADQREKDRDKALDDLENAETEEGFDDAQDRVVDSKPKP